MNDQLSEFRPLPSKKVPIGRYWKAILSNIPDSVTVYDADGNVVYANELASKDLRYSTAEHLMQQNISDITGRYIIRDDQGRLISEADLPTNRALREHVISENTVHFSSVDRDEDFWLIAKAFPIVNRRHQFKFVVSTYHEITGFKEAEQQLKESNRRMLAILDDLMNLDGERDQT